MPDAEAKRAVKKKRKGTKVHTRSRAAVLQNVAEGKTLKKAIQGTNVKSLSTASRWVREYFHEVQERRDTYLRQIEQVEKADLAHRAKVLASATVATKFDGDHELPDHKVRLEAVKYIDRLGRLIESEEQPVNAIQINIAGVDSKEFSEWT